MASLRDLLPLQDLDTRAVQLRHRRANHELRTDLAQRQELLAGQRAAVEEVEGRLRAIRDAEKKVEDHAGALSSRADVIEKSLYDGSVTDPKELGSLQDELAQLRSHQDELETEALEFLEQADPVEEELTGVRSVLAYIESGIRATEELLTVAEVELDAQLDDVAAERTQVITGIEPDLLALYDAMQGLPGGIIVAEMTGRRCGGCHLEIPSAQAEAIRHATDPRDSTCPECGCLLVT